MVTLHFYKTLFYFPIPKAISVHHNFFLASRATMSFSFRRPKGAIADVVELEYVSALHQTDVEGGIRKDWSIHGENEKFTFDVTDAVMMADEERVILHS